MRGEGAIGSSGTNDTVILALKTVEEPGQSLASYVTVVNIKGRVLYGDTKVGGEIKLEGIEFWEG